MTTNVITIASFITMGFICFFIVFFIRDVKAIRSSL